MEESCETVKKDKTSTKLRHEIFCREYLVDFNATRAAREAGYSKKTADQAGSRLLTNVKVQEKIRKIAYERIAKTDLTIENTLTELARLAFSNIKDFVKKGDENLVIFKNIDDIPDELAAAIEAIKYNREKGIEFKLHSKTKALELCLRHLGLLIDTLKVKGDFTHTHDVSMKKLRDAINAINAIRGKGNKRKS